MDCVQIEMARLTSQRVSTSCLHAKGFGPPKQWYEGCPMDMRQLSKGLLDLFELRLVSLIKGKLNTIMSSSRGNHGILTRNTS